MSSPLVLPRLSAIISLVGNGTRTATREFSRYWDTVLKRIEDSVNDITTAQQTADTRFIAVIGAEDRFSSAEKLPGVTTPMAITFLANLPDASGYAGTPPLNDAVFIYKKYPGGATVASTTFAAGSNIATHAAAANFTLSPDEVIFPFAPTTPDPNLADVAVAWKGAITA